MSSNELILKELKNIFQKKVHAIRTSLSTVMNDLSYFSNQLGNEETQRPLEACRRISELVNSLSAMFPDIQLQQRGISEIWPEVDQNQRIAIDQDALIPALESLSDTKPEICYQESMLVIRLRNPRFGSASSAQALVTLITHGEVFVGENVLTVRIQSHD